MCDQYLWALRQKYGDSVSLDNVMRFEVMSQLCGRAKKFSIGPVFWGGIVSDVDKRNTVWLSNCPTVTAHICYVEQIRHRPDIICSCLLPFGHLAEDRGGKAGSSLYHASALSFFQLTDMAGPARFVRLWQRHNLASVWPQG